MSATSQLIDSVPSLQDKGTPKAIVLVYGNVPSVVVAASFANSCLLGKPWGPLRPNQETVAVMAFSTSQLKLGALNSLLPNQDTTKVSSFCPAHATELHVATAEGAQVFLEKFEQLEKSLSPNDMLLLELALPKRFDGNAAIHLQPVLNKLVTVPSTVVLFVRDISNIDELAAVAGTADLIHVQEIRPDHDATLTFKLSVERGSMMWLNTPKPKVISMLKNRAVSTWRREPFLHDDPEARYLMRLRYQKKTLEEIAEVLSIDKSTVKRRLDKLPPIAPKK